MAGELDGPRLEPPSGQAKRLVVFLHGYGADGNDLIDIGRAWQGLLPDTAFVSPHAPEPCGQAPTGRQWFPLFTRAPERALGRRQQGRPGAGAIPRRRARAPQAAAVGAGAGRLQPGHHDGAARRACAAPCRPPPSSAIPASSCCRTRPSPTPSRARSSRKPPVLLIHGDQDDLIPVQALFQSAQDAGRARRAGRVAPVGRRRPRHRPGGPAPRRHVPGPPIRPARLSTQRPAVPRFAHNLPIWRASQSRHRPYTLCAGRRCGARFLGVSEGTSP